MPPVPAAAVPEITPVLELSERPEGRLLEVDQVKAVG